MSQKAKRIVERFIVPSILTAALIAVSFYSINQNSQAQSYRLSQESGYRRAFSQLCDDFYELEVHLSKLKAASSSPRFILLLDDIWRLSGSLVSLMSQIPSSHIDASALNSFIVRTGDYAHSLTKKLLSGGELEKTDKQQLEDLHNACAEISEGLAKRLESGDFPTASIDNEGFFTASEDEYKDGDGIDDFPTLIYDGPFSLSSEKSEPAMLTGEKISEEEAVKYAKEILGISSDAASFEKSEGSIPSYDFVFRSGDVCTDISITQTGGLLLWMMKSTADEAEKSTASPTLSDKLKDAALKWLEKVGYKNMRATYAQFYSGMAVINFAAVQDDVILYSDLVKVWVDTDTGAVLGMDARNYISSHKERDIKKPEISQSEAQSKLSASLEINECNMALIPLTVNTEVFCYEFKASAGNEEFIVYINAETGYEEEIFKIIDSENGQSVI